MPAQGQPVLLDRLSTLGDHLDIERHAHVARKVQLRSGRTRRMSLVAASVLVVAGVVGVSLSIRGPGGDSVPVAAVLPPDPPGALFVLPVDLDRFPVSAGYLSVADPSVESPSGSYHWAAIGVPEDGGYGDLVGALSVGDGARLEEFIELGDWEQADTSSGPIYTRTISTQGPTFVVQERGDRVVRLTTPTANQTLLLRLLDQIDLTETGAIRIHDDQHIIFAQGIESAGPEASTAMTVTGSDDSSYWVETATLSNPLSVLGTIGDHIEPIRFAEHDAWLISNNTAAGRQPYGVLWAATPHRMVGVGPNSDRPPRLNDLTDVAKSLEIVDEEAWRLALPDAQTETLTNTP